MRCFSTCFKKCKKKEIPNVYVLLLEGGKYYVGESMDVDKRISSHKKGKRCCLDKKQRSYQCFTTNYEKTRIFLGTQRNT